MLSPKPTRKQPNASGEPSHVVEGHGQHVELGQARAELADHLDAPRPEPERRGRRDRRNDHDERDRARGEQTLARGEREQRRSR